LSAVSEKNLRLHHCIYRTFLNEPRIYYREATKICGVARNTFMSHWKKGLEDGVFFPPQIRSKVFKTRKEYIYLVQTDDIHELFEYYKKHAHVIYLARTLGRFDLLIMTDQPLEIVPDNTIFRGDRSRYWYPFTPFCTYEEALDGIDDLLELSHSPSKIEVEYPEEPAGRAAKWGWKIYPYLKYNLRPNYSWIVKNVGMSFSSFYDGYEYLLDVCNVLLPHYPFGFQQYSHRFLVVWSDYEQLICDMLGLLPAHVSITKINDALFAYVNIENNGEIKKRVFDLCYELKRRNLVSRLWTATATFYWVPD
jgi:hypothetical protein